MFTIAITIHVIVCVLLILLVMIQQGKGGGLIDAVSSAESIFGTKTNTFLIKSTSVLSVIFFITCLSLAFLSVQKNKSLIETSYKPTQKTAQPQTPANSAPEPETTTASPAQPQQAATPEQQLATQAPIVEQASVSAQPETSQSQTPQSTPAAVETQ